MTLNPHLSNNDKYFDSEFPECIISPSELVKLFGNHFYLNSLKEECRKLYSTTIELNSPNGGWELVRVYEIMKYEPKVGLHMKFDNRMKPFLLDMVKGNYTAINIEQIFKLTSPYAVRLLELCLQYKNMFKNGKIKRSMTEESIRFYLNVPENAYIGRIDNFKKNVLDEPIKEITEKTDFIMNYTTEKVGRRIKNFVFELNTTKVSEENCNIQFKFEIFYTENLDTAFESL